MPTSATGFDRCVGTAESGRVPGARETPRTGAPRPAAPGTGTPPSDGTRRREFLGVGAAALATGVGMAGPTPTADARRRRRARASRRGRVLLRNAYVITMDPEVGDVDCGDVAIADGRIAAVGRRLPARGAEVVDARDAIVIPGLVDPHRHLWQGTFDHLQGDASFLDYMGRVNDELAPQLTPAETYAGTVLAVRRGLACGVTTMLDWAHAVNSPEHADASVEALDDSGSRAVFAYGPPGGDVQGWWFQSDRPQPNADHVARVADRAAKLDRLDVALAVRGPEFTVPEVTEHDLGLARQLGLRITMHCGIPGFAHLFEPVKTLAAQGLLASDMTLVHCAALDDEDFALIKDAGATVALSPEVDLQMGLGRPPVERVLKAGLDPVVSVDTPTAADGDLFFQLRLALQLGRAQEHDHALEAGQPAMTPTFKARQALAAATAGAARAVGLPDRVGMLREGHAADLIVLRDPSALVPPADPVAAAVLGPGASAVERVYVDGRLVKRNWRLLPHGATVEHVRHSARAIRRIALRERRRLAAGWLGCGGH
jgi:cytosine/adenosine deaminase-related metal-dependent hydrolase